MNTIKIAQGSYAKFKIKVPGKNLVNAEQVHAFVYSPKGEILKQYAKVPQSGYSALTMVPGDDENEFTLEIMPSDTKNAPVVQYYYDVQLFETINAVVQPLMNPSYLDENKIFHLLPSIAKNKPSA